MAEQCIVCLDTLLHTAVKDPPPPPLPDGAGLSGPHTAPGEPLREHGHDAAVVVKLEDRDAAESNEDDRVAVIQICGHKLHDTCLREWTAKANSCPICRQTFHLVDVYDRIGGTRLSTYTVEDKKQVAEFDPQAWLDEFAEAEDEDISTPCPICNLADHEEVLLLCDGCDTPYHTHCIGLDSVPEGAWFCMECVDLFGNAVQAPSPGSPQEAIPRPSVRRAGANRARNRNNDFFPRTRQTMRRARRRARSDEWQGAWGQITGRVWDALSIDLDHDEDEALEEYRRVERLHDNERREFERWQERLDIARRLGAQDIFERNIPMAILNQAARSGGPSQSFTSTSSSGFPSAANARAQVAAVQQRQEERRAWGDLERARDCEQTATAAANGRKRKARSVTASPAEPPQEPERKLKRPRTRRVGAPSETVASSSKSPTRTAFSGMGAAATNNTTNTVATASGTNATTSANTDGAATSITLPHRATTNGNAVNGTKIGTPPTATDKTNGAAGNSDTGAAAANSVRSPQLGGEPPSFLSSLLKEVEMSTPADDENIRSLFADPLVPPPVLAMDPSSPAGSSPSASASNSPRAMSTTPPPQRALRPSSPTLLSSHILPVYPPANYSPTRPAASSPASGGGVDHSDSENTNHATAHQRHHQKQKQQHRSPNAVELRQPRPRSRPAIAVPRSPDSSPTRPALPLETKESISKIVRSALNPHWKSSQLSAAQYAAINRDVSRKLYEEVTDPAAVGNEARKLWEQKANQEVARAVADLQV